MSDLPSFTLVWPWLAANSETLRNLAVAAVAALAVPFFVWRGMVVHRAAEAARRQAAALEREMRIAELNHATAQLGNPEAAVRAAAIYTLERNMEDETGDAL